MEKMERDASGTGPVGTPTIWDRIMTACGLTGIGTIFLSLWKCLKYLLTSSVPVMVVVFYLFSLWYMNLYQNVTINVCVPKPDANLSEEKRMEYINDRSIWILQGDGSPLECHNPGKSGVCSPDYECVTPKMDSRFFDVLNFNNIFSSYTSVLVIALNDFSEWICQAIMKRKGKYNVIVFVTTIMVTYCVATSILAAASAACNKAWKKQGKGNTQSSQLKKSKPDRHSDIPYIDNGHSEDPEEGIIRQGTGNPSTGSRSCIDRACGWECSPCCDKVKDWTYKFIFDPFIQIFIVVCLVVHTAIIFTDHHNMSQEFAERQYTHFYAFTVIFMVEAVLKIIALSPRGYFRDTWNIFEFILAVLPVIDMIIMNLLAMFLSSSIILLRTVRLARFWPCYENSHNMYSRSSRSRWQLIILMFIFISIMAGIGMNIHGPAYQTHMSEKDREFRWHTIDFSHSFLLVFRAICGEWVECLLDCVEVSGGWSCFPFYLIAVLIGDFVMVSVLTMSLVFSGASQGGEDGENVSMLIGVMSMAADRFINLWNSLTSRIGCRTLNCCTPDVQKSGSSNSSGATTAEILPDESMTYVSLKEEGRFSMDVGDKRADPGPCCAKSCYKCLPPNCADSECWTKLRRACYRLVNNQYFEIFVIVIIIFGTITMGLNDSYDGQKADMRRFISYTTKIISVIYFIEMGIRLIGLGCKDYFENGWRLFDFILVTLLFINIWTMMLGSGNIALFQTLSSFRLLRILSQTWRFQSARVVFNTLFESFPGLINVWLVGFMIWMIFAIWGVQLFGGKFYQCMDMEGTVLNSSYIPDVQACFVHNFTWVIHPVNFDHVLNAFFALTQVATFKGWISIIHNAVDSKNINEQPEVEVNMSMGLYFIVFIIFCSYNIYIMWFGVLIDGYNRQRQKTEIQLQIKGPGDVIYNGAIAKINELKPQKPKQHSTNQLQASIVEIVTHINFDTIISTAIIINLIILAYHHVAPSEVLAKTMLTFNIIFIVIYSIELALRMGAQQREFVHDAINIIDAVAILLAIISISYEDVISRYVIPPMMLRLVRLASIFRSRRWLRRLEGVLCLLSSLTTIVPHLLVVSFILFVLIFIYAVMGVTLFKNAHQFAGMDELINFETLPNALIVMSQLFVTNGWDGVVEPLSIGHCKENSTSYEEEGYSCPSAMLGILYCVTFIILTYAGVLTCLTVIILNVYTEVRSSRKLTRAIDDSSEDFYKIWAQYDPTSTGYISLQDLSSFLEMQEDPLRVVRANSNEIAALDIPIVKGNRVHHRDVYDALYRRYLAREGKPVSDVAKLASLIHTEPDYEAASSTLWRRREIKSALLIQKTWSAYKRKTMM